MRPSGDDADRPQFPDLREEIGEDPARYLATDIDPTPRIRGISDRAVASAWLAIARRLVVDEEIQSKIEQRREYLDGLEQQVAADGGERDV